MRCSELLEPLKVKILLLFFLLLSTFSYGNTVIYLKKEVHISKESVNLSDIADVRSDNPAFKSFLESIHILDFSQKAVITAQQIKDILRKNYINLDLIEIVGEKVKIRKKTPFITEEYLRERIISYLSREYKGIKVKSVRCSFSPFKAKSHPEVKLSLRSKSSSHMYVTAVLYSNIKRLKKINCTVKYVQMIDAVVAKKDLMKGQVITEEDVEIKEIEMKRGVVTDLNTVKGAVVKRFVKRGKPIKLSMIEIDYPVKKKDYVRVIYDRKGIKVEITGQALENGMVGQSIKVKNISTGKLLRCKVIGRNTVLFIGGY